MAELVESGLMVEAILALVILEILAVLFLASKGRTAARGLLPTLASGAFLLLAARAALLDQPWTWMAAFLAAAGLSHVIDLMARLRGK